MKNSMPEVHVTTKKNRLKNYDAKSVTEANGTFPSSINRTSNVFLKDGQEFEIELFNPTQNVLGVKIELNGDVISNSIIVIRPGQRHYLERFIDEAKRFVFKAYKVERSKETEQAVKSNGDLKISFYQELPTSSNTVVINTPYYYADWNMNINGVPNNYYAGGQTTASGTGVSGTVTIPASGSFTTTISNSTCANTGYFVNTASSCLRSMDTKFNFETENLNDAVVETGRVEKGAHSSQTFDSYYGSFNSWPFHTATIKMLPESAKPVDVAMIREYCTGCGKRKRHTADKFCGSCGNKF